MSAVKKLCLVLAIMMTLSFITWFVVRIVAIAQFDMGCVQYLKRAANASSVELAKQELSKAISYAESHELTDGFVSIIWWQPQNDIGHWYRNLQTAYAELEALPEDATVLEESCLLLRIRGSLVDEDSVTVPDGIEIHPYNSAFLWWGLVSFFLAIFFFITWGLL